ncbi:hypothetical protein BGZ74_009783 [Mortierella antarctica]|nr:hypothetical protein BGZ74_009783 [Mortierella antarctica]KAG0350055.1 hypothetical protein BG005_010413 [Podila minutissima]
MAAPAYTPIPSNPFSGAFPEAVQNQASSFGLSYLQKFREERLSSLRPVSEFFDKNRFSQPNGLSNVTSRLNYNLTYFQGNYLIIFIAITAYSILTNFWLMFSVAFMVGGMYFISRVPPEGVVIASNTFTPGQLRTYMIIASVPLFFLSSTLGTIFWIVGASAVLILGHAAVMQEGIEGDFVATV